MRGLVRVALWGSAAAASLLVVALSTQTDTGNRRIASVYALLTGSPHRGEQDDASGLSQREREARAEALRLTESLRNLSEDRDRLLARMTALERNYEDVTGSIGRLATIQHASSEAGAVPPLSADIVVSTSGMPAIPAGGFVESHASTPLADAMSGVGAKAEFGVDIAGGSTIASLRTTWNQIRSNHAALLGGMHPVVAVRDGKAGQVELRLVAGPIANAATAAKLCAALAASGLSCQPAIYDGQRLALR